MFTLLHELAHIVLGHVEPGRFRIDEANNGDGVANDIERQADEQASAWIFPTGFSPPSRPVSASTIASLAREHGVHPSIVIGRLQRDGVLPILRPPATRTCAAVVSSQTRRHTRSTNSSSFDEYDHGVGPHTVMRHRLGGCSTLHEFLKHSHVGNLKEPTDPIRVLRVDKRTERDAQGAEHFSPLRRRQPVLHVIDFVVDDQRGHGGERTAMLTGGLNAS